MYQRGICVNICVNVAHVSSRLKFDTFLAFILSFKNGIVMIEPHCHKKNRQPVWRKLSNDCDMIQLQNVRRFSTKLLVFSKVFLKISQISLENTCTRYNMNVKVWLYAFSLHLCYKRDACKQFFSSEFCRIFKKIFLLEHTWTHALTLCLTYLNQTNAWKLVFYLPFFTEIL